ncbi:hypothetical protein HDU98_009213 [Podochytrium sp. JEL0797]|nr:hypothetical protein HDU98_009213 [Podochytrium sp. JEL0797]
MVLALLGPDLADTAHSAALLAEIFDGLSLGVISGDASLATEAARTVTDFVNLKYSLSVHDRTRLVSILLQLVSMPDIDFNMAFVFTVTALKLAKKEKCLDTETLRVPWRPLWDLIRRANFPHKRDRTLSIDKSYAQEFVKLARLVRNYFPPSAPLEILDEFMPKLSPNNVPLATSTFSHMLVFLSTKTIPEQRFDKGPAFFWIPMLFGVWGFCAGSLDMHMVSLLSRLSEDQIAHPERCGWTEEMVQVVWECGMRDVKLPVGNSSLKGKPDLTIIAHAAHFVVNIIYPPQTESIDGYFPPTNSLALLNTFLQASETYFHPSNHGTWSLKLAHFLHTLALVFLKRWRKESLDDCETPPSLRLTPEIKHAFVETVQKYAFVMMFSKDATAGHEANLAIKNLAWLEPGLVLPKVIERVFPAMETLTETHRTRACLNNVCVTILPLLSRDLFASGAQNFLTLLHLVLPGVDMNDPGKTASALVFLSSAFMCVPVVDVSGSHAGEDETEDDRELRLSTAGFEEWLMMLLSRIFVMFENLPQIHGASKRATSEDTLLAMTSFLLQIIFNQTSAPIHDRMLAKLSEFVAATVIPSATKAMGKIIAVAGGGGGTSFQARKLQYFLPLASIRIRDEMKGGAGAKPTGLSQTSFPFGFTSLSDSSLHWFQYVFLSALVNTGEAILEYRSLVERVIEEMVVGCKSYRGVKWAAKTLQVAVMNCVGVYPREYRCFEGAEWDDSEFMASSYKQWGKQYKPKDVNIDWHVPTDAEIEFAVSLVTKYAALTMDNLTSLMQVSETTAETSSDARREQSLEFTRWFLIFKSVVVCAGAFVAPWDDVEVSPLSTTKWIGDERADGKVHPSVGFLGKSSPHHQTILALRFSMGELVNTLVTHFEKFREDDVAPLKLLIKCVSKFVSCRGVKAVAVSNEVHSYRSMKKALGTVENWKVLPRHLQVKLANITYMTRVVYCCTQGSVLTMQTESHLTSLFNLTLSRYAHVRASAQHALRQSIVPFEDLRKVLYKRYLDRLTAPKAPEHIIKGCLFMLRGAIMRNVALTDLECSYLFSKAICMPFGDKPSIKNLVHAMYADYLAQISQLSIGFRVSNDVVNAVAVNFGVVPDEAVVARRVAEMETVSKRLTEMYPRLLDDMTELIANPATHWRTSNKAVNFLLVSWRQEDVHNAALMRVALEGCVSAQPTLRESCIRLITRIVRSLKFRAKAAGTDRTNWLKREVVRVEGDVVDVDAFLQEGVFAGNKGFIDHSVLGWYCWPQKYSVYSRPGPEFDLVGDGIETLPFYDLASRETIELLLATVTSAEFWDKMSLYNSAESSKDAEVFNAKLYVFVRVLASQFEDRFSDHLKRIVLELVKDPKEKSKHRAAAEFLSGLVRGSKNWSSTKLERLWEWVMPLLERVFHTCTKVTMPYWITFLTQVFSHRDPRRVLPIIQFVLNWKLDPEAQSFFIESKKLSVLKLMVSSFGWRLSPLYPSLLVELFTHLISPYKQVRDVLGILIAKTMQFLWYPAANSVKELVEWNLRSQGGLAVNVFDSSIAYKGVVPVVPAGVVGGLVSQLLQDLEVWRAIPRLVTTGPMIAWVAHSLLRSSNTTKFTCLPLLVPEFLKMIEFEDADLQVTAKSIMHMFAHSPFPLHLLPRAIHQILGFLKEKRWKWQIKLRLIPVLQIIFFRNLMFLTSEMKHLVLETVAELLEDPQVEVRNLAGITLSGLVRCSERESISSLKAGFESSLQATKLAKKKGTLPPRANGSEAPTKGTEFGSLHPLVVKRHAAVIGLSSLVLAFPYDVPAWMPEVLITLSSCISDQAPIAATVSKAFADFRRTHQDNKEESMRVFTEDQLSILSDLLISSSYYA